MEAMVKLDSGMRFVGVADTGHEVVMDADLSVEGEDSGARPMELLLMGLCGCTAMDTISILRKKRQSVNGLEVKASAKRAEEHPKVFTAIALHYVVTGEDVDPAAVERAIQLSAERYCPAQAMLGVVAEITMTYEILAAAPLL